jgi:hypothetical protein
MTVAELRHALSKLPADLAVYVLDVHTQFG